jgi:hypothetical protein
LVAWYEGPLSEVLYPTESPIVEMWPKKTDIHQKYCG